MTINKSQDQILEKVKLFVTEENIRYIKKNKKKQKEEKEEDYMVPDRKLINYFVDGYSDIPDRTLDNRCSHDHFYIRE